MSAQAFFVAEAHGVFVVGAEGGDGGEAGLFVEFDGFVLVDSGFEADEGEVVGEGVGGEVVQEGFGEALVAELGADVHAFEFGVGGGGVGDAEEAAQAAGVVSIRARKKWTPWSRSFWTLKPWRLLRP